MTSEAHLYRNDLLSGKQRSGLYILIEHRGSDVGRLLEASQSASECTLLAYDAVYTFVNLFICHCASLCYIELLNEHIYVHFCRFKPCVRDDVVIKQRKYFSVLWPFFSGRLAARARIARILFIVQWKLSF